MPKGPSAEDLKIRRKAIKEGKTTYTRASNGQRYTIRNLNNRRHSHTYGGQGGRDELSSARKGNRGGGRDGTRAQNEQLATPEWANRGAFGRAMADANAQGMDGDHIQEVQRVADGIRWKESSGRGTRDEYHENFRDAGVAVGNQAGNVQALPPDVNQRVKPGELRDMDKGIKDATGGEEVMGPLRNLSQREQIRISKPPVTPKANPRQTSGGYQVRNKSGSQTPPISSNRNVALDLLKQVAPAPMVQALTATAASAPVLLNLMKSLMINPGGL